MKPIADRLDYSVRNTANLPKPGGFGVLYKCPQCGHKFNGWIAYQELQYCYHCGQSLFWGGCVEFVNSQMSDRLKDKEGNVDKVYERGVLQLINELNEKNNTSESLVFISETQE